MNLLRVTNAGPAEFLNDELHSPHGTRGCYDDKHHLGQDVASPHKESVPRVSLRMTDERTHRQGVTVDRRRRTEDPQAR